jgi:UDP-N-acetylglucosamine--N-acetylmuramyl-(pentapeptide) pyrophosphoryl-undecaprenol N-acetylglucosamine transferase
MSERRANASASGALPVVVLAGGGTGGHVFPMVAVADALRAEADVRVVYVGTARGIESRVVSGRGDELELLDVLPIKGRGVLGAFRGVLRAAGTLPRARALVSKLAPRAVLAVGGYAAGPLGLAARLAGVPLAVLEPNSVPGLANRWLLPFARRAYVAFPETEKKVKRGIAQRTGVPLRGEFRATPYVPASDRLRVLILGGSQGAQMLNEIVPRALAEALPELGALTIVHQAGKDRDQAVRASYEALGIGDRANVLPFLDDVASELERADLVIERSGASSLAELCAVGRASILVPFPFAADDHQRRNAQALASEGAALYVDPSEATPERVAAEVRAIGNDVGRRLAIADAARALGRPDAARSVALDLLSLAGIERSSIAGSTAGAGEPSPRGSNGSATFGPRMQEAGHV